MSEIDELRIESAKIAVVEDLRKQVANLTSELATARQLIVILRRSLEKKNAPPTEPTLRQGETHERTEGQHAAPEHRDP